MFNAQSKKNFQKIKAAAMVPVLLGSMVANAALDTSAVRGESKVEIPVAGKRSEVCILPKHHELGSYTEGDSKSEKALCSVNEYTNAAICPKLSSTNPGLEVHLIPEGKTIAQVEAANCKLIDPQTKKNTAKKLAKYKLSTSCSYSPAILGYYHVSRFLGDVLNIPVSVIRTVDLQKHIGLADRALSITKESELIHITWQSLANQLKAGSKASRKDSLLTTSFDQSYGALVKNPKGDFYKEFFNGGKSSDPNVKPNVARAINFRNLNPAMINLNKQVPVEQIVSREFNAANVQKFLHMKDASDMIVMDYLLNQEDRYGNIDAIETYTYLDRNNSKPDGTFPMIEKSKLEQADIDRLGAVPVMRVVLSDNDCGVSRLNVAKEAGLNQRINHIDPKTYTQLLKLNAIADQADTKAFFSNELLFTSNDYKSFRDNLKTLASQLHKACVASQLRLDLNAEIHFSGQPVAPVSCEI